MVHALLQVDCTEMCVGSACTQPSYTHKGHTNTVFDPYSPSELP